MTPSERIEFVAELEATEESYVRRKLMLGMYPRAQADVAKQWISECDRKRQERAELDKLTANRKAITWTRVRVGATLLGSIVLGILHYY